MPFARQAAFIVIAVVDRCFDHALKLRDALPGDWLWISPQPDAENHCS
ncbi:hypothetical protein, partial [Escherichia coli]